MTADEFARALPADASGRELRDAWFAWARTTAPNTPEPSSEHFEEIARRRASAARARTSATPLGEWAFAGTLRASQRTLLAAVEVMPPDPLHIVAPPGAGKTLIGLLLAARRGTRAVVFSPTTTIARQWSEQARTLAPDPRTVSEDPTALGDLTVLTYQRVSVPDRGEAFEPLAREDWIIELVTAGRTRSDADTWLTGLADTNPKAYRAGVRRRAAAARRRLSRESPERLAAALHPNARALVDALVAHGVQTVILDECHHLLDHWALVIAFLTARIRESGADPLLIGLTATLPSPQDASGYENYTALLGDVDIEQPTPAIVREGNLAPYRDIAWFTEPTEAERGFLAENDRLLALLIATTLGSPDGRRFLRSCVGLPERASIPNDAGTLADADPSVAIGDAFEADFALAESASAMLRIIAPDDPDLALLPDTRLVVGDGELRLLARFLLEHVLPDPARADDWQRARKTLADFGYALTDHGIRRSRDPIDSLLSTSAAKDDAVADILALEHEREGHRLRAVVVCDFAEHGNRTGRRRMRAGALRCFTRIVADERLTGFMPVLVTGTHLRVATRDLGVLLPRLGRALGVDAEVVQTDEDGAVSDIAVAGVKRSAIVAAVSALLSEGIVRVVVGTRGLLGEGWDCPAANTLIDLTTASTSMASQQLRGRTMRLDPAWAEKVAHNWTVVAVHHTSRTAAAASDLRRLRRKLAPLWGVRASGEPDIVRGAEHTLTAEQQVLVRALRDGEATPDAAGQLTTATLDALPPRSVTRERWCIGAEAVGVEQRILVVAPSATPRAALLPVTLERTIGRVASAVSAAGAALAAAGVALVSVGAPPILSAAAVAGGLAVGVATVRPWREWGSLRAARRDPLAGHAAMGRAVLAGLVASGAAPPDATVIAETRGDAVALRLDGAGRDASERFRTAVLEVTGRVRTPRFLLETDRGTSTDPLLRTALGMAARGGTGTLLPVPTQIGRRRAAAEAFAAAWNRDIGPAVLHELTDPDGVALLVRARREASRRPTPQPFRRDLWV